MFIHCRNSKCKNYWEDGCKLDFNNKMVIINEDGQCESFVEGVCDWYEIQEIKEGE